MVTRDKILRELEIQEKIQGSVPDKELITHTIKFCETTSELGTFLHCDFVVPTGQPSYKTNRYWKIRPHLKEMINSWKSK